jgi:hypothetical protein
VLSEYGNDTGFAAELLGIDVLAVEVREQEDTPVEEEVTSDTEDH